MTTSMKKGKVSLNLVKRPKVNLNRSHKIIKKALSNSFNSSLNRSLAHRQTLRANNRALARALQLTKQDLSLALDANMVLKKENQQILGQLATLKRVAGLKDKNIEDEVNRRLEERIGNTKEILEEGSSKLLDVAFLFSEVSKNISNIPMVESCNVSPQNLEEVVRDENAVDGFVHSVLPLKPCDLSVISEQLPLVGQDRREREKPVSELDEIEACTVGDTDMSEDETSASSLLNKLPQRVLLNLKEESQMVKKAFDGNRNTKESDTDCLSCTLFGEGNAVLPGSANSTSDFSILGYATNNKTMLATKCNSCSDNYSGSCLNNVVNNLTLYPNSDMELTSVLDHKLLQQDDAAYLQTSNSDKEGSRKTCVKSANQKIVQLDNNIPSFVNVAGNVSLAHKKDKSSLSHCSKDGNPDERVVNVRLPKPGKMIFSAARKGSNDTRKIPDQKPQKRAKSKQKLSAAKKESESPIALESLFDFHNKTPVMFKKKPHKSGESVFDISLAESECGIGDIIQNSEIVKDVGATRKNACKPPCRSKKKRSNDEASVSAKHKVLDGEAVSIEMKSLQHVAAGVENKTELPVEAEQKKLRKSVRISFPKEKVDIREEQTETEPAHNKIVKVNIGAQSKKKNSRSKSLKTYKKISQTGLKDSNLATNGQPCNFTFLHEELTNPCSLGTAVQEKHSENMPTKNIHCSYEDKRKESTGEVDVKHAAYNTGKELEDQIVKKNALIDEKTELCLAEMENPDIEAKECERKGKDDTDLCKSVRANCSTDTLLNKNSVKQKRTLRLLSKNFFLSGKHDIKQRKSANDFEVKCTDEEKEAVKRKLVAKDCLKERKNREPLLEKENIHNKLDGRADVRKKSHGSMGDRQEGCLMENPLLVSEINEGRQCFVEQENVKSSSVLKDKNGKQEKVLVSGRKGAWRSMGSAAEEKQSSSYLESRLSNEIVGIQMKRPKRAATPVCLQEMSLRCKLRRENP